MRYRNAISYAILLVIAYDIKDIANAIKKISHEISLRYRNDAISHAISHLSRIQMTRPRYAFLVLFMYTGRLKKNSNISVEFILNELKSTK